jgi:hypothetical protein
MPTVSCPTCGLAVRVNDRGQPATCPDCQDWLPPAETLPDALPVRKRRPFLWPAVWIPAALVASVAALVGGVMLAIPKRPVPAAPPPVQAVGPLGLPEIPEKRLAFAIGDWTATDRPVWVNEWADGVPAAEAAEMNDKIEPLFQRGVIVSISGKPNVLVVSRRTWVQGSPEATDALAKAVGMDLYLKGFGDQLEIRADDDRSLLATSSLRNGLRPIK